VIRLAPAPGASAAWAGLVRPRLQTWGATPVPALAPVPGDDLVPARWQTTRGVTIAAPVERVWPLLVQLGWQRAGWYSLDALERLVGAGDFAEGGSADGVLPRFQGLAVGDPVPLGPGTALTAVVVDAPRALVLQMAMDPVHGTPSAVGDRARLDWTWAFVLAPRPHGSRLVVRVRAAWSPRVVGLAVPPLLEPVHLLMEATMLRGIARRAASAG
ncbi:START-like domain superfamily protein, partial [Klenkia terrae]